MSEQTKKQAQDTEYYLRNAEVEVSDAERSAQGTGDKSLTQKVTKIREGIHEVRKELSKKLGQG